MAIGQSGAGLQPDPSSMAQELRPVGAQPNSIEAQRHSGTAAEARNHAI
jgi:hypothetical protein